MSTKSEIQEHGLCIVGMDDLRGSIWVNCPYSFIYYATHMRRLGTIHKTGIFHIYELEISDRFSFNYALSAVESDIDFWSRPDNYRKLIDGLVLPDRTMIPTRGIWN